MCQLLTGSPISGLYKSRSQKDMQIYLTFFSSSRNDQNKSCTLVSGWKERLFASSVDHWVVVLCFHHIKGWGFPWSLLYIPQNFPKLMIIWFHESFILVRVPECFKLQWTKKKNCNHKGLIYFFLNMLI